MLRRTLLRMLPAGAYAACACAKTGDSLAVSFASLEKHCSGRLGVAVLDTGSGLMRGYRQDERFAMCSTFKMLLAAAVLKRCDSGYEDMQRSLDIPRPPSLGNSPLTAEHAGAQMTLRELCRAVIIASDNTAANLLIASLGGPAVITQFARSLGDSLTRLDRTELALNEAIPGDPRDTTSPASMVGNMQKLILGDILSTGSKALLTGWMVETRTGIDRLRAGFPGGWRIADKTGSNAKDTTNDIAVAWPASRSPILVAAYLTECSGPETKRNAVLAQVARLVTEAMS